MDQPLETDYSDFSINMLDKAGTHDVEACNLKLIVRTPTLTQRIRMFQANSSAYASGNMADVDADKMVAILSELTIKIEGPGVPENTPPAQIFQYGIQDMIVFFKIARAIGDATKVSDDDLEK